MSCGCNSNIHEANCPQLPCNTGCLDTQYTDCVIYTGPKISCVGINTGDKVTVVINQLATLICAAAGAAGIDISSYTIPTCLTNAHTVTDMKTLLEAIMQDLYDRRYTFDVSNFTTDSSTCIKNITLNQGVWNDVTNQVDFYNGFTSSKIEYIQDATGLISLRGNISRSTNIDFTSGSWVYSGTGASIVVCDFPASMIPNSATVGNPATSDAPIVVLPGFNNNHAYSHGSAVDQYYNLNWIGAMNKVDNTSSPPSGTGTGSHPTPSMRLSVYVPFGATQGIGPVSMYLQSIKYSHN
jgi:archaellin